MILRNQAGFTLAETLASLVIFSLIAAAVSVVYMNCAGICFAGRQRIEVQENLRYGLNRISREIRQADGNTISLAYGGRQVEFIDSGGELSGYRFDAVDKEIEEEFGRANWLPIASNIQELKFEYDIPEKIITVTAIGEKGNSGAIMLTTKVHLRAP